MAWEVENKVNFVSGGDTTTQAFRKHIDEIARIYGLLNGLNDSKVEASAVTSAINQHRDSPNPHPNWTPSASVSFENVTGTLDGSRITGALTNATIPYGQVSGLAAYISGQINNGTNGLIGVSGSRMQEKGYVKFTNGLTLQWGRERITEPYGGEGEKEVRTATFSQEFTNACLNVSITTVLLAPPSAGNRNLMPLLHKKSKTNFEYSIEQADMNNWEDMAIEYLALGY